MKDLIKTTEETLKPKPIEEAKIVYGPGKNDWIGDSALKTYVSNAVSKFLTTYLPKEIGFNPDGIDVEDPQIEINILNQVIDELDAKLEKAERELPKRRQFNKAFGKR